MATILIADDDEDLVMMTSQYLEGKGHKTLAAYDGIAVMEMARQQHPDLIILDWKMPAGAGSAALEMLAEKKDTRHIPVIILSGVQEPYMQDTARAMGVRAIIRKPCDSQKLLEEVEKVING